MSVGATVKNRWANFAAKGTPFYLCHFEGFVFNHPECRGAKYPWLE